jgi:NADPH-dependent 2,4-dienoyl-CoA reductase/sulfur reductase-like enzyme
VTKPVVIVGASMAGLRTAEALRRFGYTGAITAIGDESYGPYNRPPLSKEVLVSDAVTFESVAFAQRAATADVTWVLGNKAVAANLEGQTVTCADGQVFEYSNLVTATGLRPKRADFANNLNTGRHAIRSLDDAIALRAELKPGARVVVLGAGFVGCETAATAKKLGCDVTIVAPSRLPIQRILGDDLAAEIMRRQQAEGVNFVMGQSISDLIGNEKVEGVVLDNGVKLPCDVLIEAIGSLCNVEWLAGNDINISDGVLTDANLHARKSTGETWSNVFAVGDIAKFENALFDGETRRVEHWNIPTESGKHVGQQVALQYQIDDANADAHSRSSATAALASLTTTGFRPVPSFWSDQFDVHLLAFGMLALADENRLVQGGISGDCVFEYYRGGKLVGVAGIGMRSVVQNYRNVFAQKESK